MESCSESYFKTVILSSDYILNWTIENFKNLPMYEEISHPKFSLFTNQVFSATIKKSIFSWTFEIIFVEGCDINVTLNLCVSDGAGNILYEESGNELFYKGDHRYLFDFPIESVEFKNVHAVNFKCRLHTFEVKSEPEALRFQPQPLSDFESLSALSGNLETISNTRLHTDIALKVDNGNILSVHKSILCARSPVFARMFDSPMAESEKNAIEIPDLKLAVLENLVQFIYTGVLGLAKDDFESAYALYYAADKYDVSTLRRKCIDIILSNMTVENACRVLVLADQHSDNKFEKFAMDFIKFHFKSVQKTNGWSKLEPGLLDKVMVLCSGGMPT